MLIVAVTLSMAATPLAFRAGDPDVAGYQMHP